MIDKYKQQFANAHAEAFRTVYPDKFEAEGSTLVFDSGWIAENLEKPKDPKMGRFALPVFRHAKLLGDKPPAIASKVSEKAEEILAGMENVSVGTSSAGGFINGTVCFSDLAGSTISDILTEGMAYADSTEGNGQRQLVEYSSPNIAKPFGIGHLRSTIIGNSLRKIYQKLGYDVIGINYPGDWGTQFGKMIVAYRTWGDESYLANGDVSLLLELYVRFHEEADKDDTLNDQARAAFAELESGNEEAVALWEQFKQISRAEFDRIYSRLGVEFDLVIGESFFNDKMDAVIERLEKQNLTSVSQGALVVKLSDDPDVPPCLLRKADGATLYATRDLAGLLYRWETYPFHESLYVVGTAQADHFKQCLQVIDLLEQAEHTPVDQRMVGRVHHVDFGWVKFDNQMMSTRKGKIIFLEEVIDKAVALVKERIMEKNPGLSGIDETAEMIGIGAVVFSQLSVKRQRDVNFIWDEVLNFDGETGPYLQYTHARLCSLKRRFDHEISPEIDLSLLDHPEEQRIVENLADFPQALADSVRNYDPFFIATYLLRLSASLNSIYQRKDSDGRIDKIISDNGPLTKARMALIESVRLVLAEGLRLLGINAPEEM